MITKKLLLVAALAASLLPAAVRAQSFSIEIGDRPYYSHGPRYYSGDWEMIWVPGHWTHHHQQWVHGHYARGQHRHYDRHHDDRHDRWEDSHRNDDRH
jgi:hypothetical protein